MLIKIFGSIIHYLKSMFGMEKIGIDLICKLNFVLGCFRNKKWWFYLTNPINLIIFYLKSYQNWKDLIGIDWILKFKYKSNQIHF